MARGGREAMFWGMASSLLLKSNILPLLIQLIGEVTEHKCHDSFRAKFTNDKFFDLAKFNYKSRSRKRMETVKVGFVGFF